MEVLSSLPYTFLPRASQISKSCEASHKSSTIINIPRKRPELQRAPFDLSWDNSKQTMEFFRPQYVIGFRRRYPTPRDVIVRSEAAEAGSADASYFMTDLQLVSKVRGVCFYATTAFVAIFLFMVMLVAHPFVLLFDRYQRKVHHLVAKAWATLTVLPFFKVEFEGLDNLVGSDTPAVYVSNHQSFLDIYSLLILGRSFKFISKTQIFIFPIIGWAMYMMGTIPLKRMDGRSQLDCLKRCMDLVRKGASVFFFPEGTRSKDGKLGTFKKGAFSVAAKTGVPIVPVTLLGTGKLMPAGMEGTLHSGSVKVVIHKPIEGNNPDELCEKAKIAIASALLTSS